MQFTVPWAAHCTLGHAGYGVLLPQCGQDSPSLRVRVSMSLVHSQTCLYINEWMYTVTRQLARESIQMKVFKIPNAYFSVTLHYVYQLRGRSAKPACGQVSVLLHTCSVITFLMSGNWESVLDTSPFLNKHYLINTKSWGHEKKKKT